jgi:hypothetical protein
VSPARQRLRATWAVVGTELTLRLRNPSLPVLLALVLAACALLVPDPSAGYAVVTIDGMKPVMSAGTALAAAGIVLGILLLPVYGLALDVGHARDRRTLLDRLHLASPADGVAVMGGRMLAALAFVLLTALLALAVVSSTVAARYGSAPPVAAAAAFLLIVLPAGICAALVGALLDRFLPERSGLRATLAFAGWMLAVGLYFATRADLFGIGYVALAAGRAHPPALSVGVISTRGLPPVDWRSAPLPAAFALGRLGLAGALVAATAALVPLLGPRPVLAFGGGSAAAAPVLRPPSGVWPAPTLTFRTASTPAAALRVAARWLGRSRSAWAAMALALVLALVPGGAPGPALAAALAVPMLALSRTSPREVRVAATLEATTPALLRPSPALMHAWVLALLAAAPALPAVARMPAVQAATALAAAAGAALWLVWTHRCAPRPLLGVSTFAAVWYADTFNDLPAPMDVLGLWHPSAAALAATATFAAAMLVATARHDRRGAA